MQLCCYSQQIMCFNIDSKIYNRNIALKRHTFIGIIRIYIYIYTSTQLNSFYLYITNIPSYIIILTDIVASCYKYTRWCHGVFSACINIMLAGQELHQPIYWQTYRIYFIISYGRRDNVWFTVIFATPFARKWMCSKQSSFATDMHIHTLWIFVILRRPYKYISRFK